MLVGNYPSLRDLGEHLPAWWLWLTAVVGHGFLLTTGLNVLYARPLPHLLLKFTRKVDLLVIFLGPLAFFWLLDPLGRGALPWEGFWAIASGYALACSLIGMTAAPAAQIRYWCRRQAPQKRELPAEVIDVAAELGHKPIGRGKYRRQALLPGNQVFEVEFRTLELPLERLAPAWDGLTLLHLTDLHFSGTPDRDFHHYVLQRCMDEGVPDIIAITGDVVDSKWHHRWILPLLGRLRWNVAGYAILGNHDSWYDVRQIRRRLARLGLKVLGNSWERLTVRGAEMAVVGHEGPWFTPIPDLAACPESLFKLCLSHTPDNLPWARKHGIDLMLAGHVHGGQIRLPLIGSIFCPSRYSRRYDCGTFYEAPTLMHVSRGLAGQHPLRYRCRPEVTRIILRTTSGK